MNSKLLLNLAIFCLLAGCASTHVPSSHIDPATIIVENPRILPDEKYRPFVAINVNGKRAERTEENYANDPESSYVEVKINPGNVELKIEVTAYKFNRAKYNSFSTNLDLPPNSNYQLITVVPKVVGQTINSDSWAEIRLVDMENGIEVFNKKIVLKDNWMRSIPEDQSIIVPVIL